MTLPYIQVLYAHSVVQHFHLDALLAFLFISLPLLRSTNAAPTLYWSRRQATFLATLSLLVRALLRVSGRQRPWNFAGLSQGLSSRSFCVQLVEFSSPKLVEVDPIAALVRVPVWDEWHVSIENQLSRTRSV